MAFRRTGRRRASFGKRQTYWTEGTPLSFDNFYQGEPVQDPAFAVLGRSHVVELVGAVDLPDVGGEGAVVKRIVGHVKTVFGTNGELMPAGEGIRYVQFYALLTRPEGTQLAQNDPALLAPWLLPPVTAGLGNEDILHTKFRSLSAFVNSASIAALHDNTVILDGANIVHPRTDFWLPESDYDVDFTVSRKLNEDKTLFMITQWQPRGATADPAATFISYEGGFRCLVMKGL